MGDCAAASAGLTPQGSTPPIFYVTTKAQLTSLSECTSIDYLRIQNCVDCTEDAWCALKLQFITGKDAKYGSSLAFANNSGIKSMCGVNQVKGELTGSLSFVDMAGLTSLDGAEGITSVGLSTGKYAGNSINLQANSALTSTCGLTNAKYPAGTLIIYSNAKLQSVPSAWPATDGQTPANTIPHGRPSCPSSGPIGSAAGTIGIMTGVLVALVCAAVYVCYYRKKHMADNEENPLHKSLLGEDALEMGQLHPKSTPQALSQVEIKLATSLHPVGSPEFDPEEGFPTNDSARALCAKHWTSRRDLDASLTTQHTTRVQYADLQAATNNFGTEHKIGDGGSCVVYKVEMYGVPCAIKLLSQDASAGEGKQFTAEIDVLTRVKHENICRLYACSTDGPSRCLVLELMDTSLEDRVCNDPPLGWEQRTYILVCVCRGLVHLHNQSPPLIHRDVKSDNGKLVYIVYVLVAFSPAAPHILSTSFWLHDQLSRRQITGEDRRLWDCTS
jgi:hypothetical protein